MTTITKEELENFIRKHPFPLKPGQSKISFPLVARIHNRIQMGYEFDPIRVNEGMIVDGHHRYICLTILGMEVETIQGGKNTSFDIECTWKDLSIQEEDYDDEYKKRQFEKDFPT